MDGTEVMIDPHNEVRKLQELVKKLEQQNEVLRSKTPGTDSDSNMSASHMSGSTEMNGSFSDNELVTNNLREKLRLADLEDVDYLQLPGDDDDWLYKPSSRQSPSDGSEENLISWIRQDFDHPTPERESSRKALVHFIEEAARMKHSSSSPMLGVPSLNSKSATQLSRSTGDNTAMAPPSSSRLAALQRTGIPASGGPGRKFDGGTFTRPKRPAASNLKGPFHGEGDQVHAPNVADIENLAKQQEENLRQSVTPSKNTLRNKHPLVEGDNGARTSPSRFDVEGSYMSQHRGSFSSDQSTPPDSPHNSQHFQLSASSTDGRVRKNLPVGPPLQYRSHNSSDSSLERHSVDTNGSDEMNLAPEAMRAPSSRLQAPRSSSSTALPKRGPSGLAPGLAKPQQRGVSPQRQSGLPTARRQIARPSTGPRSSLPQFRRPVTPSSRPAPTQSQDQEANWRDGCF